MLSRSDIVAYHNLIHDLVESRTIYDVSSQGLVNLQFKLHKVLVDVLHDILQSDSALHRRLSKLVEELLKTSIVNFALTDRLNVFVEVRQSEQVFVRVLLHNALLNVPKRVSSVASASRDDVIRVTLHRKRVVIVVRVVVRVVARFLRFL